MCRAFKKKPLFVFDCAHCYNKTANVILALSHCEPLHATTYKPPTHVFELWAEPEHPEITYTDAERTCKPHAERPWSPWESNPESSCCEVPVLTASICNWSKTKISQKLQSIMQSVVRGLNFSWGSEQTSVWVGTTAPEGWSVFDALIQGRSSP